MVRQRRDFSRRNTKNLRYDSNISCDMPGLKAQKKGCRSPHTFMFTTNGTIRYYTALLHCCCIAAALLYNLTSPSDEGRHRGRIEEFGKAVTRHRRQISWLSIPNAAVRL